MDNRSKASIQMIADFEGDVSALYGGHIDGAIPVLATRNMVLFPGVMSPILVGREQSVRLLDYLDKSPDAVIAIFAQKDPDIERPKLDEKGPETATGVVCETTR